MATLSLRRLIKISRPRFWIYLLGPFLIGLAASMDRHDLFFTLALAWPVLLIFVFHFTFSSNLLLYGINDIFDYETDRLNPKKQTYEALVLPDERSKLVYWIAIAHAPIIAYLWLWWPLVWQMQTVPAFASFCILSLIFLLLAIGYSAPPIRAKARPFLDSLFNVLYIIPGLIGYLLSAPLSTLSWPLVAAASLWCLAMHAYSAIPDIDADKKAGIQTIATKLGSIRTLWFCVFCYAGAALISAPALHWLAYTLGALYLCLMGLSFNARTNDELFRYYKLFPWLNAGAGAALFFFTMLMK